LKKLFEVVVTLQLFGNLILLFSNHSGNVGKVSPDFKRPTRPGTWWFFHPSSGRISIQLVFLQFKLSTTDTEKSSFQKLLGLFSNDLLVYIDSW
jgi:hypothetical protein